ncbi:MAG: ATP-binding protein, partial [Oceanicaulis sp.]
VNLFMDRFANPYAPGAGTQPPELAGREPLLDQAILVLERLKRKRSEQSMMVLGLRGVGKTVLLNRILAIAEERGYEAEILESPEDRDLASLLAPALRRILIRLSRRSAAAEAVRTAIRALRNFASAFELRIGDIGVGVTLEPGVADTGDLETDLPELFDAVGKAASEAEAGVALLIDEVQYLSRNDLAALLVACHKAAQRNHPVAVFGAGLPQLAGLAGEAKSYAERLFSYPRIGALEPSAARRALIEPAEALKVEYTKEAVSMILSETRAYPYFLQEWGYHVWAIADESPIDADDVAAATAKAIKSLDENFFSVRFDRLTPKEQSYLRAMAQLGEGPHRSGAIAEALERSVNQVAPLRNGLIKKGMIYSPAHGDTAFTVPMFDAFLKRQMPDWRP